jgi:hypothetical protein
MKSLGYVPRMARWAAGLAFATAAALSCATVAHAQTSAEDQYGQPTAASSGPAAGSQSCGAGNGSQLGAGDSLVFPGDFSVAPGASVVVEDSDGTRGTLIDGQNASITGGSSISVALTGDPTNVSGGDGVLNGGAGCNSVVATTGVSAVGDASVSGSSGSESLVGILPDTGGESLLALLAGLASVGTGLLIVQRLRARANRASRG